MRKNVEFVRRQFYVDGNVKKFKFVSWGKQEINEQNYARIIF